MHRPPDSPRQRTPTTVDWPTPDFWGWISFWQSKNINGHLADFDQQKIYFRLPLSPPASSFAATCYVLAGQHQPVNPRQESRSITLIVSKHVASDCFLVDFRPANQAVKMGESRCVRSDPRARPAELVANSN